MKEVAIWLLLLLVPFSIAQATSSVTHEFFISELDNSSIPSDYYAGEASSGIWIAVIVLLIFAVIFYSYSLYRKKSLKRVKKKVRSRRKSKK